MPAPNKKCRFLENRCLMKAASGLRKSDVLPAFQALLGELTQCGYG